MNPNVSFRETCDMRDEWCAKDLRWNDVFKEWTHVCDLSWNLWDAWRILCEGFRDEMMCQVNELIGYAFVKLVNVRDESMC